MMDGPADLSVTDLIHGLRLTTRGMVGRAIAIVPLDLIVSGRFRSDGVMNGSIDLVPTDLVHRRTAGTSLVVNRSLDCRHGVLDNSTKTALL